MTDRTKRPIGIDLFAGAGGMSLGFEQAGFDIAAAVELDPIHCAVHEFNFPNCKTICGNATQLSGKDILKRAGLGGQKIDVVFGGPPCQGFSMIGKRAFDDPRNSLVGHFVRLVRELDADFFVFENVKGLTVGEHKAFLKELVDAFGESGYAVRLPWMVLNAASYGVPQNRHRLFLFGGKKGLILPDYPRESHAHHAPGAEINGHQRTPTVADALGDLPDADRIEALIESDSARVKFGVPSRYAALLRGARSDGDDFSHPRAYDPRVMTSSLRTEHMTESKRRFEAADPGKVEPVSRFFKLDSKGISNTIRAGTASDRGAFTSPRPIHPIHPRCITVREAARLHSYPDWFRFHATKWHGARQVGNSVPPLLARAVAGAVVKAMGRKPSKPKTEIALGNEQLLQMDMGQAARHFGVSPKVIAARTRNGST